MKLNHIIKYTAILALPIMSIMSCVSSGDNPGIEYAPNMYISQAYEPYSQDRKFATNPHGMTMREPVNGTIARGQLNYVYPYPNSGDGYAASAEFTGDVESTEENIQEGERLYNIYCWHCHGKKGKNDGPIFKEKKMPAPSWPNYQSDYIKELPVGKAYHTITYGKGLMGSHAFMLDPEERWKVIHYVKTLANNVSSSASTDTTSTADMTATDTLNSNSVN
jgi:mono/diheme cytochrome c family protein